MGLGAISSPTLRFGIFELDFHSSELRKSGVPVKLQPQPFKVLALLAARPRQLVTRQEIQQQIWGAETFVDFERGLNFCIKQIRAALQDDVETPRFIETLPKRGYRFLPSTEQVWGGNENSFEQPLLPPKIILTSTDPPADPVSLYATRVADRVALEVPSPVGQALPYDRSKGNLFRIWALAAGTIIAVGFLTLWLWPPAPIQAVKQVVRLTHDKLPKSPVMATDDSSIYFSVIRSNGHTTPAMVPVAGGETATLSTPFQDALLMDISPDGSTLLISELVGTYPNGRFWALPKAGGSPRRLGDLEGFGATWSPDGRKILYPQGKDLYVARQDGTEPRKLVTAPGELDAVHWSPDGKRISMSVDDGKTNSMWEVSADGTNLHPLLPNWKDVSLTLNGVWTPDNKFLLFDAVRSGREDIWAMPERVDTFARANSMPMKLTEGSFDMWAPTPSKDGNHIFVLGGNVDGELVQYDAKSRHIVPYLSGIDAGELSFSRDGKWVAYVTFDGGTLWRSRMDGTDRLQLTYPPMELDRPPIWETSIRWSPDGNQIAFAGRTNPGSGWSIYLVSAAGGNPRQITKEGLGQREPSWSSDGNSVMYMNGPPGVGPTHASKSIEILELRTHRTSTIPGSEGLYFPRWSPDARYILAKSTDCHTLVLFDFNTQKWSPLGNFDMISSFDWSHDGRYIYAKVVQQAHGTSFLRFRIADRKWEHVADLDALPRAFWAGLAPDDSLLELRVLSQAEVYALEMQPPL